MVIARALDLVRRKVYRGEIKNLLIKYKLNDYIRSIYWSTYKRFVDNEMEVNIREASAVFPISTYSEYRVINALQGPEKQVIQKIINELNHDDVFWDIGANIGTFSCVVGDVLTEGKVIAFEPYPPNVQKLAENLDYNNIDAVVKTVALSDSDGETTFYAIFTDEAGTEQGSIESEYTSTDDAIETVTVKTTTGDQLLSNNEIPLPNVVKIDVEGAALKVIEGMARTLKSSKCRLVFIEPHDNSEMIEEKLLDIGFKIDSVKLLESRSEESPTIIAYDPQSNYKPVNHRPLGHEG